MLTSDQEYVCLRNLSTDELLRYVDRGNPQVRELALRLELYCADEDQVIENTNGMSGTPAGVS